LLNLQFPNVRHLAHAIQVSNLQMVEILTKLIKPDAELVAYARQFGNQDIIDHLTEKMAAPGNPDVNDFINYLQSN
jgi:predicted nucleotide-binding protein (sugar kinase/HSP70/actin superfamily)